MCFRNSSYSCQFEFVSITQISQPKSKFGYPWKWLAARRFVGGSGVGGIKETQEMLDFCGEHNITCMIEKIPISYINTAMERLAKVDVKYRFVIDIGNSLKSEN